MAMRRTPGSGDERSGGAAQLVGPEVAQQAHPAWCDFDAPGALGGVEHYSRLFVWRSSYLSEVVVVGWLRRICYADGGEETPAVVLQVDNPDHPGEIALAAEDLDSLAEHLLSLRGGLRD
jgi:hypothetical protein